MKYLNTICFLLLAAAMCSCGSKTPWNPYLSMKEKPSEKQMRETRDITGKGNKAYAEQMEKNKKAISDNDKKFFKMRKHYPHAKVKKQGKIRR